MDIGAMSGDPFMDRLTNNAMMQRKRALVDSGTYPYYQCVTPLNADEAIIDGKRMILMGTTNYLGLNHDPRIKQAAIEAIEEQGTSCTASRALTGNRPVHEELEAELASFLGKEAVLVFTTGYLANIGAIPALIGRHDAAIFDAEVHACLLDGIKLSGADTHRFRHNDLEDLEAKLISARDAARKLIIVDSLYSLGGDLAPLDGVVELAEKHGAWVFLDDAHGLGVLGPNGRGLAADLDLTDRVQVIMGVFSKSFASIGGFIAGSKDLIESLRFNARSFLFSNALPPANAAAALAVLRIIKEDGSLPSRALERAERGRQRLRAMGLPAQGDAHLVPIIFGDDETTVEFCWALAERGVWVSPALPPGVPKGKALLRNAFSPTMPDTLLTQVFEAFQETAQAMGFKGSDAIRYVAAE